MKKFSETVFQQDERRRVPAVTVLFYGTILLVLLPVGYELGYVLFANWMTMAGHYTVARTPILDTLSEVRRVVQADFSLRSAWIISGNGLKASTAVPFAILWAVLMAVVFLRRAR